VPVSQLAAASSELHILLADDTMCIINVLVVLNKLDSPVCPQELKLATCVGIYTWHS
jgi:hypothetical protein